MNLFLYATTVLIWGSTWLAIYFQLGEAPILVSVFFRFALAAVMLLPVLAVFKKLQKTSLNDQLFILLQACCLFSFNFICFYQATQYISSGLVSVIFSLATLYNAVNNRLFYREPMSKNVLMATVTGVTGLVILFWPELMQEHGADAWLGVGLAALGTLFFSFGNMISKRHSRNGIRPVTTNAYGMAYGAIILFVLTLLFRQPMTITGSVSYWVSLLYLSVFGSIIGFTAYLTLVARIGASQAAYATVLFPIIALFLSSLFEGYQWSLYSVVGIVLTILGNLWIHRPEKSAKISASVKTVPANG